MSLEKEVLAARAISRNVQTRRSLTHVTVGDHQPEPKYELRLYWPTLRAAAARPERYGIILHNAAILPMEFARGALIDGTEQYYREREVRNWPRTAPYD